MPTNTEAVTRPPVMDMSVTTLCGFLGARKTILLSRREDCWSLAVATRRVWLNASTMPSASWWVLRIECAWETTQKLPCQKAYFEEWGEPLICSTGYGAGYSHLLDP